jgi:hypothetical protein
MLSGIRATRTGPVRVEMSDEALGGVRHPQFPQKSHHGPETGRGRFDGTAKRGRGKRSQYRGGGILPHLAAGDVLVATGVAESVDAAKTMCRGRPERWFFLTPRSLFHLIDCEPAPWACFKRDTLRGEMDK